ncbi:MAG TPA: hypothetical protein VF880_06570 [Actinomycetes bacterium]
MPTTPRSGTPLAWSLWLLAFGCCAAGLVVALTVTRPLTAAVLAEGAVRALVYPLGYATIGLVLTLRRPANPIGWLFAAAGLAWSLPIPAEPWLDRLVADHRPLPLLAQAAAVYGEFNWAPATVLGVTLPALLVPDGHLRSPRWRPVAATAVLAAALVLVGSALAPSQLEDHPIPNPFALPGPAGTTASALAALGTILWIATMVASLTCVVLRFRSSRGVERQQLRWVAAGAAAAVLGVTLPALLVPDGRLRSPRWRPVAATALVAAALVLLGSALAPSRLEDHPIPNPFALPGPAGTTASALVGLGTLLWIATMVTSLTCVVLRFRASHGVERQQLRWVAAGATAAVLGLLLGAFTPQRTVISSFSYAMVLCIPTGVAVAVLRYRLWDLDRLVSRTVTYAAVTGLLILPYLLILPIVTRIAGNAGGVAVAAATLTAVALFAPLRRRIQDLVDRRFNRRRYDAARTVEAFAVRLRDQVDLDALQDELLTVVDQTVQPTTASLWLRPTPS